MTLHGKLVALVEELRGVAIAARNGDQKEVRRIVRCVGDDLRDLARRVEANEFGRESEATQISKAIGQYDMMGKQALAGLSVTSLEHGFDPHGFFVYMLWGKDTSTPLYIGQSRNILSRLGTHLGDVNKHQHVVRVSLIQCESFEQMCRAEKRMIQHHQPPWNVAFTRSRKRNDMLVTSPTSRYDSDS